MRLAKNDISSVFGSVLKKTVVLVRFRFYKLITVSVFGSFFWTALFNVHDTRNDTLPCWIGPTNCQPKWLRTRSAEGMKNDLKTYSLRRAGDGGLTICWLLILSCCKMNCEWDNVKNRPQNAEVSFLKSEPRKPSFRFLNFEVGSVFRKPISKIFVGFRTPIITVGQEKHFSLYPQIVDRGMFAHNMPALPAFETAMKKQNTTTTTTTNSLQLLPSAYHYFYFQFFFI